MPRYYLHPNQITVGEFMDMLKNMPPSGGLFTEFMGFPLHSGMGSYRGIYEDFFIGVDLGRVSSSVLKIGECYNLLNHKIGREMYGWKGGIYKISKDCPLWVAEAASHYSNTYVTGLRQVLDRGYALVQTQNAA